jgi:hypothetical protein
MTSEGVIRAAGCTLLLGRQASPISQGWTRVDGGGLGNLPLRDRAANQLTNRSVYSGICSECERHRRLL